MCPPPSLPPLGCCDVFSHSLEMLRCVLLPPLKAVMCVPPPSGCYDTLLRLRMRRRVLHHVKVAAQAIIARKVDQDPCPQHEEVAHALDQHIHPSPPPTIEEVCCDVFPLPSGCCDVFSLPSGCCDVFPLPSGCCDVFPLSSGCCDVFSLPSGCCDVFSLPSGCCDVFSLLSSSCNVFSTSPRHSMMLCVLSLTQVAAQAVTVKKVDQHAPPPPEESVHTVEEAAHPHPLHTVQVSPSFPVGDDDVCDRLVVVTDEQGGLAFSVFLLSHIGFILRRFFPQLLFPSLSYLGKLLPLLLLHPSPMTLLHIPQPSLPMVRARTTTVWSLYYTPRLCESSPVKSSVLEWSSSASGVSVVRMKYRGRVGAVYKIHHNN